jgi:hypothetical protein
MVVMIMQVKTMAEAGVEGADLQGIHYLRVVNDADAIKESVKVINFFKDSKHGLEVPFEYLQR